MPSTALVPAFRRRVLLCARCRVPCGDDHICHDRVRHPSLTVFLSDLRAVEPDEQLAATLSEREPGDLSGLSPEQLETVARAFSAAFRFVNMPASEQRVALAILDHAKASVGALVDL